MDRWIRGVVGGACAALLVLGAAAPAAAAEPAPSGKAQPPAPGVIATIGETQLTDADLMSSLPEDRRKAFQSADQRIQDIEGAALQEIFARRYVEEQAKAKGVTPEAFLASEIEANRASFGTEYKVQVSQVKSQIYEAKRAALDEWIGKTLTEKAAKERGVTVEALEKAEVEDKIAPITPEEVDAYYNQNRRMFGAQPKEAVAKQIEEMLRGQKAAQKRTEFRNTLRAGVPVRVFLEVPRIEVSADDDPIMGSPQAPVQIVIFSEFQCPYCSRVKPTFDRIHQEYGDKVAFVFRDFPLSFHNNAGKAAEAGGCAAKQGKFWPYHDKLFANQQALSVPDLKKYAQEVGLDVPAFTSCLDSGEMKAEVEKDMRDGSTYGVQGTPASFVNGRFLSGAQPFESFKKVIDDELSAKGITVPVAMAAPSGAPQAAKN